MSRVHLVATFEYTRQFLLLRHSQWPVSPRVVVSEGLVRRRMRKRMRIKHGDSKTGRRASRWSRRADGVDANPGREFGAS